MGFPGIWKNPTSKTKITLGTWKLQPTHQMPSKPRKNSPSKVTNAKFLKRLKQDVGGNQFNGPNDWGGPNIDKFKNLVKDHDYKGDRLIIPRYSLTGGANNRKHKAFSAGRSKTFLNWVWKRSFVHPGFLEPSCKSIGKWDSTLFKIAMEWSDCNGWGKPIKFT